MTTDWTQTTPLPFDELPTSIRAFLSAHQVHDLDAEIACFEETATVTDEGNTYDGRDAIRAWLSRATSEYTYTSELIGTGRLDSARYDVVHHLEGDFPGGVVDLHFRFTLRDDMIADLVIEP